MEQAPRVPLPLHNTALSKYGDHFFFLIAVSVVQIARWQGCEPIVARSRGCVMHVRGVSAHHNQYSTSKSAPLMTHDGADWERLNVALSVQCIPM